MIESYGDIHLKTPNKKRKKEPDYKKPKYQFYCKIPINETNANN